MGECFSLSSEDDQSMDSRLGQCMGHKCRGGVGIRAREKVQAVSITLSDLSISIWGQHKCPHLTDAQIETKGYQVTWMEALLSSSLLCLLTP